MSDVVHGLLVLNLNNRLTKFNTRLTLVNVRILVLDYVRHELCESAWIGASCNLQADNQGWAFCDFWKTLFRCNFKIIENGNGIKKSFSIFKKFSTLLTTSTSKTLKFIARIVSNQIKLQDRRYIQLFARILIEDLEVRFNNLNWQRLLIQRLYSVNYWIYTRKPKTRYNANTQINQRLFCFSFWWVSGEFGQISWFFGSSALM